MWKLQFIAFLKYLISFFKRNWELSDYPIRLSKQEAKPPGNQPFEPITWTAQIFKWWHMNGCGNTREEALSNLQQHFEEYKQQFNLPRPGKPVRIQFAPTVEIAQHVPLARDFLQRVMNRNFDNCWISDRSSLWDFLDKEDKAAVFARIRLAYGVDVSDIQDGFLVKIFKRIEEHRQAGP